MISRQDDIKNIKGVCYLTDIFIVIMIVLSIQLRRVNMYSLELVSFVNALTIIQLGIFTTYINEYRRSNCINSEMIKIRENSGIKKYLFFQEIGINILFCCVFIINSILYVEKNRVTLLLLFITIYLIAIYIRFSRGYCYIIKTRCIYIISILSIFGLFVISFIWNVNTEKELHTDSVYTFNNEKNFDLCKKLYNSEKRSYIILSSSDNILELRELSNRFTEIAYFDSKEKCDKFIIEQTMGRDVYIPVLSGKCSFDKSQLSVSYEPVVDNVTRHQLQKGKSVIYFIMFEVYIILQLVVLAIYNYKKLSVISERT